MKKLLVSTAMGLSCCAAWAQTANSGAMADSTSNTQSSALAVGGGLSSATNASTNRNSNSARGGNSSANGGNSNVTVNLGSAAGDPSGSGAQPNSAAQLDPNGTTTHIKESIQTVGNPGAVSYGVSFSQYNCANTASVGAGFLGGVFQFGGGVESNPCNARANASALFTLAQGLATSNADMSAKLYRAAVLLIGHSTKATEDALAEAGVSDFMPQTAAAAPVAPPQAPQPEPVQVMPVPADESRATILQYPVAQIPGKPLVALVPVK